MHTPRDAGVPIAFLFVRELLPVSPQMAVARSSRSSGRRQPTASETRGVCRHPLEDAVAGWS